MEGAAALDGTRDYINDAAMAAQQLQAQLDGIQPTSVAVELEAARAMSDLNGMAARVARLREQIEQLYKARIAVVGVEQANAEVEMLRAQLEQAVITQDEMNAAMDAMDASGANDAYERLNGIVSDTERQLRGNTNEQRQFNDELRNGHGAANSLRGALASMAGVFSVRAGYKWAQEAIGTANQNIQAGQQLANVLANQGAEYEDLMALREKAAEVQGATMYGSTAMIGGAAELATYISDAEALEAMMGTLTNYAAGMSGGAAVGYQEMVNYATQLGKALDGTYDGLAKKGFALSDAQKEVIANGTDMEKALVIDEVINQSWAGLAEQMAKTPQGMTAQVANEFNEIKAGIGMGLMPALMTLFSTVQANLPDIQRMLGGFVPILQGIIWVMGAVLDGTMAVYRCVADNWGWIKHVVLGVAAAVTVWKVATAAYSVAQWAANAALLACPITWVVVGVLVLAAALAFAVNKLNDLNDTSHSVTGMIAGGFFVLGAFLYNRFVVPTWNGFVLLANFFGNVFHDPVAAVKVLFMDLALFALEKVAAMVRGIGGLLERIPGVNIDFTGGMDGLIADIEGKRDMVIAESGYTERFQKLDEWQYEDAYRTGYAAGERLDGAMDRLMGGFEGPSEWDMVAMNFGGMAGDISGIEQNTHALKNTGEENLKYLRDMAERETINRFTTAEVEVRFEGGIHNSVSSDMDLDGIVDYINDGVREAIETTAEGVYA